MPRRERVTMLLENNPYPQDVRVRAEAESLVRAGHDVMVVAPRDPGQQRRDRVSGVDVVRFRNVDGSVRGAKGFVLEYLIAGAALHFAAIGELLRGATVLHLHNPPDLLFGAGALYRLAGRKVVFDHHDLFPETVEVKFRAGWASRIAARCQALTYAVANHVIATNASYAERACTDGRKRPEDVTVVRNGPPSAWTRLRSGPRDGVLNDVHLVYLGSISSQDGVEGLAQVLARLTVGARLTVVGDGDARPALLRALIEHRVADRVTFTGRVALERVPELLGQADVCVDPAPATDVNARSTMTKIAEYLALGKPVVAYDLLETRRTAGDAAVLVRPGDVDAFAQAIAELARDAKLRRRLSVAARHRAAVLTWDHSERELLKAYETFATRRNGDHDAPRKLRTAGTVRTRMRMFSHSERR
jgi:glycosyltransferase involved in cell wall biosynthesis